MERKVSDAAYSIILVSELEEGLRLAPETYHPEKIRAITFLRRRTQDILEQHFEIIRDSFDLKLSQSATKIRLLNLENLSNFEIIKIPQVSPSEFKSSKYVAKSGDVVISHLRPYLKQIGFITLPKVYTTTELMILRLKRRETKQDYELSKYLYVYLMTYWVQKILFWSQEGTNHPRFPTHILMGLPLVIPSKKFVRKITSLVDVYFSLRYDGETLYRRAEQTLLKELSLENWKPKTKKLGVGGIEFEEEENISIKQLSEVSARDRFDAEYWDPKYEAIEKLLKNYGGGFDTLNNLVSISKDKVKIRLDEEYNYIELSDVDPNLGTINQTKIIKGTDLPSRARMKVKRGYILMSSVKGSVNKIALIDFNKENMVASTGFFIFKEKAINKKTILVLFKILAERYFIREAQGTILEAIPKNALENIILPEISSRVQQEISFLVKQALNARQSSKELLNIAKRAVELFIEYNEEAGIAYINKELRNIKLSDRNY